MTQNRQVRLDGNTSRPPSSDPLPPERVYHCNNLPTCHPHRAPIVPTYFTFRSLSSCPCDSPGEHQIPRRGRLQNGFKEGFLFFSSFCRQVCQQHHIGGLEDVIGRTDAYGHPVCSVMQVNRFTSPIDLHVENRKGVSW